MIIVTQERLANLSAAMHEVASSHFSKIPKDNLPEGSHMSEVTSLILEIRVDSIVRSIMELEELTVVVINPCCCCCCCCVINFPVYLCKDIDNTRRVVLLILFRNISPPIVFVFDDDE